MYKSTEGLVESHALHMYSNETVTKLRSGLFDFRCAVSAMWPAHRSTAARNE